MKQNYKFRISVQALDERDQPQVDEQALQFVAGNHDNILEIARRLRQGLHFDEQTSDAFAVGLKLFTEVLLQNKDDPLFTELKPAVTAFMKKLKATIRERQS